VEGAQSPPRWFGGCAPKNKKRGRVANLCNPPQVGPKALANPKLTRVGKTGAPGGLPPGGGSWGVSPHKFKRRGEPLPLAPPPHEWGPKRWQTLSQRGWAMGVQGAKPPGGGSWGVSPHKTKRGGESPALATLPRVGPKTLANPKPTRVGNGGPGGEASWRGVVGGVPPQNQKRGRVARISNPATSGTQNAGKP
jgi:hypothetical protein